MNNFYLIAKGDKGKEYGFGHIFRTIRIYKKLKKKLKDYRFILLTNNNKDLIKKIRTDIEKKISIKNINSFKNIEFKKKDFLLFDTLGIEKNLLEHINQKKIKNIISLDQISLKKIQKALIINGIFFSKKKIFSNRKNIKILQGPEYNTIEGYPQSTTKKNDKVKKILISSGGSDKKKMIINFLNYFDNDKNFKILIPIGPGFQRSFIEKFKKFKNVSLFLKEKNSLNLMHKSDLNIVNGGLTMFESIASRKPTFVVQTYNNQRFAIKYFQQKGLIFFLKDIKKLNFRHLDYFIKNQNELKKIQIKNNILIKKIFKKKSFQNIINQITSYIKNEI